MGLDMYALATRGKITTEVDIPTDDAGYFLDADDNRTSYDDELHYWRKHPDLHGWMCKLYVRKGGEVREDQFCGHGLVLTLEDLTALEAAVLLGALPKTSGFFFGESRHTPEQIQDDLDFIRKAREAIGIGNTVIYTSSW